MSFEYNGIKVDTSGFEKAIKSEKAKIESHAKYPVQGYIENEMKNDFRLMLKTINKKTIKYLSK